MEYLGKLEKTPKRVDGIKSSLKPCFTPIEFHFFDEVDFISFYSKINKVFSEQGRCIVEGLDKSKYIIDIESINTKFPEKINVSICGFRKIK
jgi:hypothetical protein